MKRFYESVLFVILFFWELLCCFIPRKAKRWAKVITRQAWQTIHSK